jgi:hypothetical protein
MQAKEAIILLFLIAAVYSTFYSYTPCTSPNYLNTANLKCVQCSDPNHIANNYQTISIGCQCKTGFKPGNNNVCSTFTTTSCLAPMTYYPLYALSGSANSGSQTCASCSTSAYTNAYLTLNVEMGLHVPPVQLE